MPLSPKNTIPKEPSYRDEQTFALLDRKANDLTLTLYAADSSVLMQGIIDDLCNLIDRAKQIVLAR